MDEKTGLLEDNNETFHFIIREYEYLLKNKMITDKKMLKKINDRIKKINKLLQIKYKF